MTGTNWTNITTFEGILSEANRYAPFWAGMLFMMWFVLVITFLPFGLTSAILGGSFIAFIIGIFLIYAGLMSWKWILMIIGVMLVMIIYEAIFAGKDK